MKKNILYVVAMVLLSSAYLFSIMKSPEVADASVNIGNGYMFKVASTSSASATVPYRIRGGVGILGSLVIASSSDVRIRIYDSDGTATSSATSTMIADFPANTTAGTYTFDVNVVRGVAVDLPSGFKGFFTFTYR